jgi:Domain of unknown function (DUF2703)
MPACPAGAGAPVTSENCPSRTFRPAPGGTPALPSPRAGGRPRCVPSSSAPSLWVREFALREDVEMAVETKARPHAAHTSDRLRIEFLFLDLITCTRYLGADRSLESELDIVREVLQATGAAVEVEVEVDRILVESAEQARALRFVSSPTVRVDGHDVALELRESLCGSEACGDRCGDQFTAATSTPIRRSR